MTEPGPGQCRTGCSGCQYAWQIIVVNDSAVSGRTAWPETYPRTHCTGPAIIDRKKTRPWSLRLGSSSSGNLASLHARQLGQDSASFLSVFTNVSTGVFSKVENEYCDAGASTPPHPQQARRTARTFTSPPFLLGRWCNQETASHQNVQLLGFGWSIRSGAPTGAK
jgi:hypothetical protein